MDFLKLLENSLQNLSDLAVSYGPKVLLALLVLFIGTRVINFVSKQVSKMFEKSNVDLSLRPFLSGLIKMLLRAVLIISVAQMIGIETTSFVAVLGAGSLAIGLALQGSLSNFAGGVLILIFRPFKIGDMIEAQGFFGLVKKIDVLVTFLETPQNKVIILPNGPLINGNIVNHSGKDSMRLDVPFGVSYEADIDRTRSIILEAANQIPNVLKSPAADVVVTDMGDNSVNFLCRVHISGPDHYFQVGAAVPEYIKKALDKAKIEIPFPQRVIHMKQS